MSETVGVAFVYAMFRIITDAAGVQDITWFTVAAFAIMMPLHYGFLAWRKKGK